MLGGWFESFGLFDVMWDTGPQYGPRRKYFRAAPYREKYNGAALRKIRKVKGVGRPPRAQ